MTPLTILLHELGHLSNPLLSGLPAQLHPTSVSGGAEIGVAPNWMVALQAGAGPLVSLVTSIWAARAYSLDRRRLWALAAAVAAGSRFLVTTGYLGVRLLLLVRGVPFGGQPNFDEHHLATAIGVAPPAVAAFATLFVLSLCHWLFRRTERSRRLPFMLALAAGIAIGSALWMSVAPPVMVVTPAR